MGSHCSKVKHTNVIWPMAVTPEMTTPGSLDGLDKIPFDEHAGEKKGCKNKKKDTSEAKTKEFEDGDGMRESHDTNVTRDRITEESGSRRTVQYQKGPAIDSNSPFAEVCECLDLNLGERLAIKSYKVYGTMDRLKEELELLQDEITILQDLYHENLIRYDGMEFHEVKGENHTIEIDIIMEYASGGSVWGLIQKFSNLEERIVQNYTRQMLEGLAYLHSEGVVHGNLKGSNVLIDSNGVIKLTDIQSANRIKYFSQKSNQGNGEINLLIDSIYWTAPEVLINKKIEAPADVWSVGCVVLEMLTGLPPWESRGRDEAEKRIICGYLPPIPEDISDNCKDFLAKVFKYNPEERPSIQEMLEHPFVQLGTEKDTGSSSMSEGLQSMQSFSVFRNNTGLLSLPSLNQNTPNSPDAQAFDSQSKYNIAININNPNQPPNCKGNKVSPGRNKKSPKKNLDLQIKESPQKPGLPNVEETNIEEEESSPNEKLYRKRRSAEFKKKDWAGLKLVGIEDGQNGEASHLKPEEYNIRKSKTEEYQGVLEQGNEKVDTEKNLLPDEDNLEDDENKKGDQSKKPFAPMKSSLFKKLPKGDSEEDDKIRYSIKDIKENQDEISPSLSNQPSRPSDDNSPTLTKEEQRKRIEQEIMNQLMRLNSKDLSQDFSASFEASRAMSRKEEEGEKLDLKTQEGLRKKFAEELRRQLAQDLLNQSGIKLAESGKFVRTRKDKEEEGQGVDTAQEQRRQFEEDLKKQLERIGTGDLMNMSQSLGKHEKSATDEKEMKESKESMGSKESKGF